MRISVYCGDDRNWTIIKIFTPPFQVETPQCVHIVPRKQKLSYIYTLNAILQENLWRKHNTLTLKGPRLFGLENEPPDDLQNIFYRNVRYCIYINRKKACIPSLKYFKTLIRDELKLKFRGTRILTRVKSASDKTSLDWLRNEMGWSNGIHIGHPLINPHPNSQTRTWSKI